MDLLTSIDLSLAGQVQAWSKLLYPGMQALSAIGLPLVLSGISLLISILGLSRTDWRKLTRKSIAFASVPIGLMLNTGLKLIVARPRPDTLYASNMLTKSFSFPSGHAYGSLLFFGLIAYYLCRGKRLKQQLLILIPTAVLVFLIGCSRVYLGAHYPTDVLGGWLLAAISLWIVIRFVINHKSSEL